MGSERQAGTARGGRRARHSVAVLAVAGLALTASACSGGSGGSSAPSASGQASPSASGAPSTSGSADAGGSPSAAATGVHASPAAVVTGFYTDVAKGDFAGACSLIDPAVIPQLLLRFGSCQVALEQHYTDAMRAKLQDVQVDQSKVSVVGNGAFIPQDAITFGGKPSQDGDQQAVRNNGVWFLSSPAAPSQQ